MKLIFNNVELNTDIEHELLSSNGKYFDIEILHAKESKLSSTYGVDKYIENLEQYTEVHYLYGSIMGEKRIAFESVILHTGFTRDIKEIESVTIKEVDINE